MCNLWLHLLRSSSQSLIVINWTCLFRWCWHSQDGKYLKVLCTLWSHSNFKINKKFDCCLHCSISTNNLENMLCIQQEDKKKQRWSDDLSVFSERWWHSLQINSTKSLQTLKRSVFLLQPGSFYSHRLGSGRTSGDLRGICLHLSKLLITCRKSENYGTSLKHCGAVVKGSVWGLMIQLSTTPGIPQQPVSTD